MPSERPVEAPAWLSEAALTVWNRLGPDLIAKGVLTHWDVDLFGTFYEAVTINRAALVDLAEHGATVTAVTKVLADGTTVYGLTKNPAWSVARESAVLLTSIGGRFGLTPSDRASLHIKAPETPGRGPGRLLS